MFRVHGSLSLLDPLLERTQPWNELLRQCKQFEVPMKIHQMDSLEASHVVSGVHEVSMKEHSRSFSVFSSHAITLRVPKKVHGGGSVRFRIDSRLPCDVLPSFMGRFLQVHYVASLSAPHQNTVGVLPLNVGSMHPLSYCPKCDRSLQERQYRFEDRVTDIMNGTLEKRMKSARTFPLIGSVSCQTRHFVRRSAPPPTSGVHRGGEHVGTNGFEDDFEVSVTGLRIHGRDEAVSDIDVHNSRLLHSSQHIKYNIRDHHGTEVALLTLHRSTFFPGTRILCTIELAHGNIENPRLICRQICAALMSHESIGSSGSVKEVKAVCSYKEDTSETCITHAVFSIPPNATATLDHTPALLALTWELRFQFTTQDTQSQGVHDFEWSVPIQVVSRPLADDAEFEESGDGEGSRLLFDDDSHQDECLAFEHSADGYPAQKVFFVPGQQD
jgi:hypothetical protein